jgi:hypothetical protein
MEPTQVALRTSDSEQGGHHHVAVFNGSGNGYTSEAPDGHSHRIRELEVQPARGHTHELTEMREPIPEEARDVARHRQRHRQVA